MRGTKVLFRRGIAAKPFCLNELRSGVFLLLFQCCQHFVVVLIELNFRKDVRDLFQWGLPVSTDLYVRLFQVEILPPLKPI